MNKDPYFNYHASRAKEARFALNVFKPYVRILFFLAVILFVLAGLALLLGLHSSIGWFILSLGSLPAAILLWHRGRLVNVPVGTTNSLNDRISSEVLAKLPETPTPKQLVQILAGLPGGQFFAARFGLSPNFLQDLATDTPADMDAIWEYALSLRERLSAPEINAAMLLASTTATQTEIKGLLPHLQLEQEDIEEGVRWHLRIKQLIANADAPKRTGGIARDWSFGYVPTLERFAHNVSAEIAHGGLITAELDGHKEAVGSLLTIFTAGGRQNAALVGGVGSGKSTVIKAFAEQLLDAHGSAAKQLRFNQIYSLDPSALISAAPGRGELERLMTRIMNEAYRAKNIVLCLDDAHLFFEEGVGSVDISNLLMPAIDAGGLKLVLALDEQRWLSIAARNPNLTTLLNRIPIKPTSKEDTLRVLEDQLLLTEYQHKVTYMYQALGEAIRLSERYMHDLVQPGRALNLLASAAATNESGFVTMNSVRAAIEQQSGVKVGHATDSGEREKLLNLETLIHERMINQTHAVKVISDAIRRARAGVRNENRPVGTFLFLGPTGVGKTELAKALADVYFGGEANLIRVDMNEYSSAGDVSRLIADGADNVGSLTAGVMKQPFSVILLDEIEKAHDSVLTSLLQVLDEGVLRDVKNREVSFRDAIIISTSNAGADEIRARIERGEQLESFEGSIVDQLVSSGQFRPEFLNRFDEIVTFRPLTKEELLQVIDLILAGINKTLALQKLSVSVDIDAKILLVEKGYDPKLGARPMRRIVQRTVENILARRMLAGSTVSGETITITGTDIASILAE